MHVRPCCVGACQRGPGRGLGNLVPGSVGSQWQSRWPGPRAGQGRQARGACVRCARAPVAPPLRLAGLSVAARPVCRHRWQGQPAARGVEGATVGPRLPTEECQRRSGPVPVDEVAQPEPRPARPQHHATEPEETRPRARTTEGTLAGACTQWPALRPRVALALAGGHGHRDAPRPPRVHSRHKSAGT